MKVMERGKTGYLRMLGAALAPLFFVSAAHAQTQDQVNFFEAKIRPILAAKCSVCHGEKVQMASLQLTTAEGFSKGADSGPIVVKGDPESSRLVQVVSYQDKIKMPPTGKLADSEIAALGEWVEMGTPWPHVNVADIAPTGEEKREDVEREKTDHWAFQPVRDFKPPNVNNRDWAQTPLDNFILAKLEGNGLEPAPRTDKLTLLRRAKFGLHGLPPTEQEIELFLSDETPQAFARLVNRLLDSPRYGEHWGRHWLGVARYADPHLYAWRYRDYVIDAFNNDLPYDQFLKEQLAGDLLAEGDPGTHAKQFVATGFLALGSKHTGERDKMKMVYDVIDEQIDTTAKAFLGLTISCARCHDHKFDPISTKDYYALASIFASTKTFAAIERTKLFFQPLVAEEDYQRYKSYEDQLQAKEAQIEAALEIAVAEYKDRRLHSRLADYMRAARMIRLEGLAPEKVSRRQDLDAEVLKKWVDYLRPDFRPFLQRWYRVYSSTDEAAIGNMAEEYQRNFQVSAQKRHEALRKWREEVETAVEAAAAPPRKPGFPAFEDRFFAEISLPHGSYEESIENGPFAIPLKELEKILPEPARDRLLDLRKQLQESKSAGPPEPPMAAAVAEGEAVEQAVFIRGSYENRGELVPKRFPAVLAGENPARISAGSGRKELAEWLTRPDHPLTSRVMANRIWQWHFAAGLVRTPNNFGITGGTPSHPQLLDYLARQFVQSGWSIKEMHRLIMLSSAYQMSSRGSEKALKADAENRLCSRFNRRRLTVEEMRDAFLALDGSLDLTLGGQVHDPVLTSTEENVRSNTRINADDYLRRTIYLPLHRHKLPSLLTLFDFGDAAQSSGKRAQSDIAPQALYLMNSGFVHSRSRALAEHLFADDDHDDDARVERAYLIALTRKPTPRELKSALYFIEKHPAKPNDSGPRAAAWRSFCKMLMISNEFHYVN